MKLRPNIVIIASFVFILGAGILGALILSIIQDSQGNDFVIGALIGLLATGLTALNSLGNNVLEKDNSPYRDSD